MKGIAMKERFHLNSPIIQFFSSLTDLVVLNVLWLICCLPIFTAGAATAALYQTTFAHLTKTDDAVVKPFFCAFRSNFKQATLCFLPLAAFLILLVFEVFYLITHGQGIAILFLLFLVIFLACGCMTHIFPLISRFQMNGKALIRTSFSLTLLHIPVTLAVIILFILPVVLLIFNPSLFIRLGILWAAVWYSLIAYFFGMYLLWIWKKHIPAED